MGAGKTTVGRELAKYLRWCFEDLDDRIQSREKRTIEEIFEQSGEAEFRRLENFALRDLLSERAPELRIVALGGGAFSALENRDLIRESSSATVYLNAPVEELYRRCCEQQLKRPLKCNEQQFRELYESRRFFYLEAGLQVETAGRKIPDVAEEIAKNLRLIQKSGEI